MPRSLGAVLLAFDVAAVYLAFITTKYLSGVMVYLSDILQWDIEFHNFDTRRYYYVFLCAVILLRFLSKGHYSRRPPWLAQAEMIIVTICFAALFDSFNYYVMDGDGLPMLILSNWGICIVYLLLARLGAMAVISRMPGWKLQSVILGSGRTVMDCFYAFTNDKSAGYDIRAVLLTDDRESLDLEFLHQFYPHIEVSQDQPSFPRFIEDNRNYYYLLGMDDLRNGNGSALINSIEMAQVEYAVIPHTRTLDIYGMEPHYFFGNDVMVLHRRDPIRTPSGRVLKRLMDIMVSALALPLLMMITLLVYIARKIGHSKTPIFYGGERVGKDGKIFNCWKFCTMRSDADDMLVNLLASDENARLEWDKFQKLKNDPRVDSSISRLLRKTSLDELPQLWNVFVGDMSLVGPRPILENQIADYGDMFRQYCVMRPGLTGVWQVSGRNETSFEQRTYWDGWYVRNWSLWYDIVILFKTARIMVTGWGAY